MMRHRVSPQIVALCIIGAAAAAHAASQESTSTSAAGKTFDVASVHANKSGTTQTRFDRMPTGITIVNLPLRAIIQFAYGVSQPSRLVGVPEWTITERFDIAARGTVTGLDDFRAMMQALLADRFKLAAHTEQRSLPVFNLIVARSDRRLGPSLEPSTIDCPPPGLGRGGQVLSGVAPSTNEACGVLPGGPGELNMRGLRMELFASMLAVIQQRPVIDSTGLTGSYNIHLLFAPEPIAGRPIEAAVDGRPSLLTALQEQLGLKLEPGKQQQDVLVIDKVSRPDEN